MHTDNKTTADWDPMTILKIELFSPSICEFSPQLQRSPTKVVSRFQVSKVFTRFYQRPEFAIESKNSINAKFSQKAAKNGM